MKEHRFRNPHLYYEQPWRKWFRNELKGIPFPQQPSDLNVQDIDLATVIFGDCLNRTWIIDGLLRIFEIKQLWGNMKYGQMRLLSIMDRLLRKGDPDGVNYGGFFFLHWEPSENCRLNGHKLSMDDLAKFMLGQLEIAPVTPLEAYEKRKQRLF